MSYVHLDWPELLGAASLLIINGALSVAFRLGLEASLAIAAVRMVVQLAVVGLVLKLVFEQTGPTATVIVAVIMVIAAGLEIRARQSARLAGWLSVGLGTGTLVLVGALATGYAVGVVIGATPWWSPRYVLPILGMVLGNALTSVSLVLETMTEAAKRERAAIEARLALGASRREALDGVLRRALRTALMPTINAMAVTGLVTLPGMMSGQILAGTDPVDAAAYQLLIMFLIAGSTALAALITALGATRLLTDDRHRLRVDRIAPRT